MHLLIIGGSDAGISAALRARELDPSVDIEREGIRLLLDHMPHNLERAADRVINICERVIFTVTGELVEMDSKDSGIESVT